jgi:hypothetical protein
MASSLLVEEHPRVADEPLRVLEVRYEALLEAPPQERLSGVRSMLAR